MLRKVTRDGYGYSVVDLNDVRHVLAVAIPGNGGTLQEQAHDALQTIQAVHEEESTRGSIVHQAVFVANPELIPTCREIITEFYGDELPATSYVIQPPCQGKLLAIEAIGVGRGKAEVHIERFSDQLVRVTHNALSWVHCANITPRDGVTGAYNQTISSLSKLRGVLSKLDVGFDHVIRTWFYQGGIVADEGDTQRYKELNRARSSFFEGVQFLAGCQPGLPQPMTPYPASTGIGTEGRRPDAELHRAGDRAARHRGDATGKPAADFGIPLCHLVQSQEPQVRPSPGTVLRQLRDHLHLRHGQHC